MNHGYRDPSWPAPFVTIVGGRVVALDAATGAREWTFRPEAEVFRVVASETHLFLGLRVGDADRGLVAVLDIRTGQRVRQLDVEFCIRTALAKNDRVFFGGFRGCVALSTTGELVFRVEVARTSPATWTSPGTFDLVATTPNGRELWREVGVLADQASFLLLGDAVAQADFDSRRALST